MTQFGKTYQTLSNYQSHGVILKFEMFLFQETSQFSPSDVIHKEGDEFGSKYQSKTSNAN